MDQSERVACATLLTDESYVLGALVLGHSLRQSGWAGDTLVLVTSAIGENARRRLAHYWQHIVEIAPIENPNPKSQLGWETFQTTYAKLRIWEREEYSKLIYLDADIIVMGGLDDLLERGEFAAAPCMWTPDEFNSGVMVIQPSQAVFQDMISKIAVIPSRDGSDQGFLNNYFPDWFIGPCERRLPMIYNVSQFAYLYAPTWKKLLPEMRALHFTGPKPWKTRSRALRRLIRWWLSHFSKAPRDGLSPFELWWQVHDALESPL